MAAGYQMAKKGFERSLSRIDGLATDPARGVWVFESELALITSQDEGQAEQRSEILTKLANGRTHPGQEPQLHSKLVGPKSRIQARLPIHLPPLSPRSIADAEATA